MAVYRYIYSKHFAEYYHKLSYNHLYVLFLYNGNTFSKIVYSIIYVSSCILIEFSVWYIFILLGKDGNNEAFVGSLVSKLIIIGLIAIVKKLYRVKQLTNKLSMLGILVLPVFSVFTIVLILKTSDLLNFYAEIVTIMIVIMVVTNILLLGIFTLIIRNMEFQELHNKYLKQYELRIEHMKDVENLIQNSKKNEHNMKNHFITIRSMSEKRLNDEIVEYLDNVLHQPKEVSEISNSGNIAIDAIINTKHLEIIKNEIDFKVKVNIPSELFVLKNDLSVILGNILDNAIESNLKLNIEDRYIYLDIVYSENFLMIVCQNAVLQSVTIKKDGLIDTTKDDKANHGLGLISVKGICEKYNGTFSIDCRDSKFKIKCILFIE